MSIVQFAKSRRLTCALMTIYLLILTWLILLKMQFYIPFLDQQQAIDWIPLQGSIHPNGSLRLGEVRNNLLAFFPLGVFLSLLWGRWPFWRKVLIIASLTLGFEAAQYVFAIGRADITDVISNILGGMLGMGVYGLLKRLLKGRTDGIINMLITGFTVVLLIYLALRLVSGRWIRIL